MKNKILLVLQLLLLTVFFSACGTSADTAADPNRPTPTVKSMTMGTGGTTGTYYAFGNVLSGYMNDASGIFINVVSTGGSTANIYNIDDTVNQLGTVQSDVMSYAWDGSKSFEADGEIRSFRVLGGLYEEAVQIVTMKKDIKTVADLKGKTVSIGAPGSGVYFNAIDVLGAYGLTEEDIRAEYLSFGESTDAMKDGKVDAAFIVSGAPTNAITELSTTNGVYLVNIEDEKADALIERCPYYNKHTIKGGTYSSLPEDTNTVSIKATMIVSAKSSEQDVYQLTKGIFDNIEGITGIHAKGSELSLENATTGMPVPFHAGAAKYFAEKGITVPVE